MELHGLTFGGALEALKAKHKIARPHWKGYLELQSPDENSKMNRPYLYAVCKDGEIVPAVINNLDMLAEDWVIVE